MPSPFDKIEAFYKFYAHLWADPNDFRPLYDLQFRNDQVSALSSLYDPSFPQLSTQVSWLNDPDPTFVELEAGAYTDLQFFAVLTFGPSPEPVLTLPDGAVPSDETLRAAAPTSEQLAAVRRALGEKRRRPRTVVTPAPWFLRPVGQGEKR